MSYVVIRIIRPVACHGDHADSHLVETYDAEVITGQDNGVGSTPCAGMVHFSEAHGIGKGVQFVRIPFRRSSVWAPVVLQPLTTCSQQFYKQCREMLRHFLSHGMGDHCRGMDDLYSRDFKHWILSNLWLIHRST